MTGFLDIQSGIVTEYDDKLARQLIEQITVFDDKLQVTGGYYYEGRCFL